MSNAYLKIVKVVFSVSIAQIGFGGFPVVVKALAQKDKIDEFVFTLLRDSSAFPVLLIAAIIIEGFQKVRQWRDVLLFAILGFVGIMAGQMCYLYGLYYTSPTIASMLQPSIPALTIIFSLIARIEILNFLKTETWLKLLGIVLTIGGAIVMILGTNNLNWAGDAIGYLLLLGNTSLCAIYIILQKKYLYNEEKGYHLYPPVTATAYTYGMGVLWLGIIAIPYGIIYSDRFKAITYEVLYPLSYAIFINSALCYGLINYGASLTSASFLTAFWPLQVPTTAVLSWIFFDELLNIPQYTGGFLIILGLAAVCISKYQQESERKSLLTKAINTDDEISSKILLNQGNYKTYV